MIKRVDYEIIKQYEEVFGRLKMMSLLEDFSTDANDKLGNIEQLSLEGQRLAYHSLRSSSLVFGLCELSELCEKLEEKALAEQAITEDEAIASRNLLCVSICLAKDYFED